MTQAEFLALPWLLFEHHAMDVTGYARNTLEKMVDCGVLRRVKVKGCSQGRYLKMQLAELAGLGPKVREAAMQFRREPLLMPEKRVCVWTGYGVDAMEKIRKAGGLAVVRVPGISGVRYRKADVAELIGLERML